MSDAPNSATEGIVSEPASTAGMAEPLVPPMPATPADPVTPGPETTATSAASAGSEATGPAARTASRRRLMVMAGLGRFARLTVMIAVFAGGVAYGYTSFQSNQPVVTAPVGDPVTAGVQPPLVVMEAIAAIASNDADRIRSAVPGDPYKLLTSELQRWDFQEVTSVETLSTFVDGTRSSTEIVIVGRATTGNPININLVVHAQGGQIVSFR